MLKNRYQEILVGMGLMSLVRGLISLKRNLYVMIMHMKIDMILIFFLMNYGKQRKQ